MLENPRSRLSRLLKTLPQTLGPWPSCWTPALSRTVGGGGRQPPPGKILDCVASS